MRDSRPVTHPVRLTPLAAALVLALAAAPFDSGAAATHGVAAAAHLTPYALRSELRKTRLTRAHPAHAATGHAGTAPANTLPVTSCLDDGSPGTLRAVAAAAGEGDTLDLTQLTCSTITLTDGPIDTSVIGDHHLYDLTITGPGRDALTIDGGGASQVFLLGGFSSDQGRVTFNDLTIAHGAYAGGLGACIEGFGGAVALNSVTVTDCHASGTVPLVFGGAVDVTTLEMTDSTISASTSTATGTANAAMGGGAYASDTMTLVRSTISGNSVGAPVADNGGYLTIGGGLYSRGDLVLVDSTISGNAIEASNAGEDARGGGVYVRGFATISGSTIDGNSADGDGGGLFKAIFSNYGEPPPPNDTRLTIGDSTITGNSAAHGAGIATSRPLQLSNSSIAFNNGVDGGGGILFRLAGVYDSGGTLGMDSSIVAANTAGAGASFAADIDADDALAVSGAHNLVQQAGATIVLPGGTLGADPQLSPLASNGGPTRTLALAAGSPAIDTGSNPLAFEFDQRGADFIRVSGAAADIGAFELQAPSDTIFRDGFEAAP